MNGVSEQRVPVTVMLRPLGVPLPLGLSALAVGSLILAAEEIGWIGAGDSLELGIVLIALVFPLQLIAGLLSFLARDPVAGTAAALTSGAWLVSGVARVVPSADERVLAFALAGLVAALLVPTALAWQSNRAVFLVLALTGSRFALSSAHAFGAGTAVEDAAAAVGLAVFALSIYTALALALESLERGPSLPLLRHGSGWEAIAGGFGEQVRAIEHEAGVRRQI